MLVLIDQGELRQQHSPERQELTPRQAFNRHVAAPLKDVLEQAIEGFNRVRAQLMKHAADFDSPIGVGRGATAGRHQLPIVPGTLDAQLRSIVVLIAQDRADLGGKLDEQQRRDLTVGDIGRGELSGQGNPETAEGHGQMQLPPIPPAVPPRLAPLRFRINGGVGDHPSLPLFLVPDPTGCAHGGTVAGGSMPLLRPGIKQGHQLTAQAPDPPSKS